MTRLLELKITNWKVVCRDLSTLLANEALSLSLSHSEPESDVSNMLNGILVMQDIQLGMLVALIPFFASSSSSSSSPSTSGLSTFLWFMQILQVTVGFPLLIIVARGVTMKLLDKFYR